MSALSCYLEEEESEEEKVWQITPPPYFNISPGWHFSSRIKQICPQIYAHVPHEFLFGCANLSIRHKIHTLGWHLYEITLASALLREDTVVHPYRFFIFRGVILLCSTAFSAFPLKLQ